jgi:hypothetical protein
MDEKDLLNLWKSYQAKWEIKYTRKFVNALQEQLRAIHQNKRPRQRKRTANLQRPRQIYTKASARHGRTKLS